MRSCAIHVHKYGIEAILLQQCREVTMVILSITPWLPTYMGQSLIRCNILQVVEMGDAHRNKKERGQRTCSRIATRWKIWCWKRRRALERAGELPTHLEPYFNAMKKEISVGTSWRAGNAPVAVFQRNEKGDARRNEVDSWELTCRRIGSGWNVRRASERDRERVTHL